MQRYDDDYTDSPTASSSSSSSSAPFLHAEKSERLKVSDDTVLHFIPFFVFPQNLRLPLAFSDEDDEALLPPSRARTARTLKRMSSPRDATNPLRHFQRGANANTTTNNNNSTNRNASSSSSGGYEGLLKNATVSHVDKEGATVPVPVSAGTHASRKDAKQNVVGKVQLAPGYSQMDWMRLTRTKNNNLNGLGGNKKINVSKRVITLEEIAKHNTEQDAWIGFRGKVYNLTPYIHFHPGGPKILEQAFGKDCTALFDKFHKYVNGEFMMRECQVGVLPGYVNDEDEDEDEEDF